MTSILNRFDDAGGFSAFEVVALLASHSVARTNAVDTTLVGAPFDTVRGPSFYVLFLFFLVADTDGMRQTPFTFDTQFFLEMLLKGVGFPGTAGNRGEVMSPLPLTQGKDAGELRLQSDFVLSRDPRTACFWQGFVNEQQFMMTSFKNAMAKLAVLGNNRNKLVDCSDVVPQTRGAVNKPATFPATKSAKDLQLTCKNRFPTLRTDRKRFIIIFGFGVSVDMYISFPSAGATETPIPHCPNGGQNC